MHVMLLFFSVIMGEENWQLDDTQVFRPLDLEEVAVAPDGTTFLLRQDACQIAAYDAAGHFVRAFGQKGQGPGEFSVPTKLFANEAHLMVQDQGASSMSWFTHEGEFVQRKDLPKRGAQYFLAHDGWMYGDWLFSLNPDEEITLVWTDFDFGHPRILASWSRKGTDSGVFIHRGAGPPPKFPYNPAREAMLCDVSPDGKFAYVKPKGPLRIEVIDLVAKKTAGIIDQEIGPVPFNETWGMSQFDQFIANNPNGRQQFEPKFPETFPLARDMRVLPSGLLAVDLWTGRPDTDDRFLVFDTQGDEIKPPWSGETMRRIVAIRGPWAYVTLFDAEREEASIGRCRLDHIDRFVTEHPIVYDGPGRMIAITIGG